MSSIRARRIARMPSRLEVEVVSLDWKWLFIYPAQGIAAVNQLVDPGVNADQFGLTSATVMNSFFVPQLGSQIYTMPGMTTHLNLLADQPGDYPGLSANFSGDGFSDMRFIVRAVPAGEFDGWVAQGTRSRGGARRQRLCGAGEAEQRCAAATYRSVDPKLFERIVDHTALEAQGARRQAGARADAGREAEMLGKLTWAAIPFNEPIPLVASVVVIARRAGGSRRSSPGRAGGPICGASG